MEKMKEVKDDVPVAMETGEAARCYESDAKGTYP